MSFLSTAFLLALPLALAPLLLHLFDRRRNVVIEWGAMQFLTEAATRRTSARKLKQWLLLLMRVLAVAVLVLALARPLLPGAWLGTADRGETVFVIDNSLSMQRASGDGSKTLFDRAIARAVELLEEVETGDSVRVLLASPYPVWASGGSLRVDAASRPAIADQLRGLRPTDGRSDLPAALVTAVQAEVEPTQRRRRIVLLGDGQGSDWGLADDAGWQRLRESLRTAAVRTELEVVELGDGVDLGGNLSVNRLQASRTRVGVHQPFTLTAQVRNHGRQASRPCTVRWRVSGREVFSGHVPALDGGQAEDVVWKHSVAEAGVYAVSCAVDAADSLPPDNRATVVVEVVEEVPVVVLEGAADRAELQQDAFFVQAALGWMHGEPQDERGVFVPQVVDPARLERLDLRGQHAVVVPNLTAIGAETVDRLREFVSRGGGLWIALGPRTDVEAFNQHFFADGNGLSPLAVERIVDEAPAEAPDDDPARTPPPTRVDPFANRHPATREFTDVDRLDTGDITVSRRFRFVAPPEDRPVSVLLSLTNGQPLAVEKQFGRGRVVVQAVPLRLEWSELARSQAFVVLVRNWLAYLTQPLATRHNLSPGEPISVRLAGTEIRDATLRTPHGDEIELTGDATDDEVVFRSSRTILPGDYALELGLAGEAIPFHVRRDPEESDLAPLSAQDRGRLAEAVELGRDSGRADVGGTGRREPLWPALLSVLVGLIAAELLLSGVIARERFGSDPIAGTTEPARQNTAGQSTATFRENPAVAPRPLASSRGAR